MTKLWGGRFSGKEMVPFVLEFTSSLGVDKVLAEYDCKGTMAHVEMLHKCGFIQSGDKKELMKALKGLLAEIEKPSWKPGKAEDIHSYVQNHVEKEAPKAAKKMHTARSRNEQVVNDVRMYCKDKASELVGLAQDMQRALVNLAAKTASVIVPGYTHLNHAQPVVFAHLVLAYVEMLQRDKERIEDALKRCDVSVMGSGAIAGSSLKINRKFIANKLGFKKVSANSIDAVSDRDFMAELLFSLSMVAVHLSRISEDLILYSIPEFGFVEISEEYCTGSSLMPQKKNPDVLELVRGKSAQVISSLNSLLVLLKGLPHSYNRDLQEDKKPLFESVELISAELKIMTDLIKKIKVKKDGGRKALENEFIYATDLAEYLVSKGVAFKDAHDTIGKIVKHCTEKGVNISDLSLSELEHFSKELGKDVYAFLDPEHSVNMKKTIGSTNPKFVKKEVANWKKKVGR